MTRDLVKRLAIQSGIDLEFFQAGELFSFATAIANHSVEDYKAKLRPVTVNSSYAGIELKLYALPSGETK